MTSSRIPSKERFSIGVAPDKRVLVQLPLKFLAQARKQKREPVLDDFVGDFGRPEPAYDFKRMVMVLPSLGSAREIAAPHGHGDAGGMERYGWHTAP
jgi:hypothetical protein